LLALATVLTPAQRAKLSPAALAAIEAATTAQKQAEHHASFRAFVSDPQFCGLTDLSPLMAAIMDASDGLTPDTIDNTDALSYFGCGLDGLPRMRTRTIVVRAGGRGGKSSRLLAGKAIHAAWCTPVPTLAPGEEAFVIIIAPSLSLAKQTFSFVRGYVLASPTLTAALVSDPVQDSLSIRRPDGVTVRVQVFAAGRGGTQIRAKTVVAALFDEAAFFRDEATGAVNDADLYGAVLQRVVPEGQVWLATTPWVANIGLVEEIIGKEFGKHTHSLCVLAPTRVLNPTWDPDHTIETDMRARDPDRASREIDAVPLASGAGMFFPAETINACVDFDRPAQLTRVTGAVYGAGGDMAFRRNSSCLVIVQAPHGPNDHKFRVALIDEQVPRPGTPLQPAAVVARFAELMDDFDCRQLMVDAHERDEVGTELMLNGMSAVDAPDKLTSHVLMRKLMLEGRLELPNVPRLIQQLRFVVGKPRPGGGMSITSPQRADGSHGDIVSALVVAVWRAYHLVGAPPVARKGRAIALPPAPDSMWGDAVPPRPVIAPRSHAAAPVPPANRPAGASPPQRPARPAIAPYRSKW
jgi:hypothetical protein